MLKNPIRKLLSRYGFVKGTPVAHFAVKRIAETKARDEKRPEETEHRFHEKPRRDFLSRFQEANSKDPDFIDQGRVGIPMNITKEQLELT